MVGEAKFSSTQIMIHKSAKVNGTQYWYSSSKMHYRIKYFLKNICLLTWYIITGFSYYLFYNLCNGLN